MRSYHQRLLLIAIPVFAVLMPLWGKGKQWVKPKVYHAKTYPARDAHDNEQVTIAADPYDMPDKAAIFTINYKQEALLPIMFIVSNDGSAPISLEDMQVQLVTAKKVKLSPATTDDIYRRIAREPVSNSTGASRNPLPIPRHPVKRSIKKEEQEEIDNSQFTAKTVAPGSTQSGFLYFDIADISEPLAGAHLYVTGVRDSKGQELMFFDIPMENYLTYQPGQK
jgi:hypothetical protein